MPLSIDKGQLGMSAAEKLELLKKQLLEKANKESAVYPMSYGQKALYFLYLNSPESPAYNVSFSARIISKTDPDALRKALQKLVNRHTVLRTSYRLDDGKPVQTVHGYMEISFTVVNVSGAGEDELKRLVIEKSREPFDLENGKVLRTYLFTRGDEDHVLLINLHHISNDGRSFEIMLDELAQLYQSELTGASDNLLPAEKYYHDFVRLQEEFISGSVAKLQTDYWLTELEGRLPDLDLPFDRQRQLNQTFSGDTVYFEIDGDLAGKLRAVAKEQGATMFATLLTCYLIFLRKHTDNDEVLTGIPAAGRGFPGFENVMGYFINPLTVRVRLSGGMSFSDALSSVKRKILNAIDNQDIPFQVIVDKLMHGRDPSRSPVFQTFFGLQRMQGDAPLQELIVPGNDKAVIDWAGMKLRPYHIRQQEGQFDITAEFAEGSEVFSGAFKYNTDLFDRQTVEEMAEHFLCMLRQIAEDAGRSISSLRLITQDESELILNKWNNTSSEFPETDLIDRMFERAALEFPENTAVEFEGKQFSFELLNRRSDALAAKLSSIGFGRGSFAAVCVERSTEMVISMLGVLKAGGAYIPVDPDYPADRIDYMISNSNAQVLITQRKLGTFGTHDSAVLFADEFDALPEAKFTGAVDRSLEDTAYVIYTSGSTGQPKGVLVPHRALANHMLWMKGAAEFTSADSVLQKTPYSFDASVWEFYLPLLNGGRLVLARPEGHMDTDYLVKLTAGSGVTHIQFVPSLLKLFIEEPEVSSCTSLKFVFSGGEALTKDLADSVFAKLSSRLVNLYGPTEAAIDSTYYECSRGDVPRTIPIGTPISNMRAAVVDDKLQLQPPGLAGELLLGGEGIALGYLNNPGLTEEKFIDDNILNTGRRLYRTGDRARFNRDGLIEYLGRIDHQVKFRGYRIELSEIESHLKELHGVKDAYVDLRKDPAGRDILAAYIIPSETLEDPAREMKSGLRKFLPEYMVPGHFVILDALPVLPNGKIDRKKLPDPDTGIAKQSEFREAKGAVEEKLLKIWEDVLGVKGIGADDNFFELGGDSILSIQIISRAAKEGIRITPKQVFSHQTIAELASEAQRTSGSPSDIEPFGDLILSPVQERFLTKKMKNRSHYNHSLLISAPKGLDIESLSKALKHLTKRHDLLRMKLNDSGKASIPREALDTAFAEFDFSGLDSVTADESLARERDRLNTLTDLHSGRLINAACFRMPGGSDRILFNVHHICIDGVSWRILLEDFIDAYSTVVSGKEIRPAQEGASFREWTSMLSAFAKEGKADSNISLWNAVTDDGGTSSLTGADLSANTHSNSARITVELDEDNTKRLLNDANRAYNTGINDLLISALVMAFGKATGEHSLVIDLEGHGRDEMTEETDISNTVGWFTAIYPVRFSVTSGVEETIKSVKETLSRHSPAGITYGMLRYMNKGVSKVRETDPKIIFNYLGQFKDEIAEGWKFSHDSLKLHTGGDELRQHAIEMNSMVASSKFVLDIDYPSLSMSEAAAAEFADFYIDSLKKIIEHCTNAGSTTYTASDFAASGLDQQELDNLLSELN
ncbi:MAG: amino acid adenylation domain-containing protein [Ignavibacteria bacterium]|nr:amino acid adenylation domain-containing protein [Ignavibacteria bacterium]